MKFIIGRTNRYTGLAYKDDPAIMSWQIGNEPRAFSTEALPAFEKWLAEASALIADSLIENLPRAKENTKEYIDRHLAICEKIKKPLVMEEFGYPRDGFKFELDTPTKGRDGFYEYVFSLVGDNAEQGGYFAGCNFWAWGGLAKPKHTEQWQVGDDYTGDLQVISSQVERMSKLTK